MFLWLCLFSAGVWLCGLVVLLEFCSYACWCSIDSCSGIGCGFVSFVFVGARVLGLCLLYVADFSRVWWRLVFRVWGGLPFTSGGVWLVGLGCISSWWFGCCLLGASFLRRVL